MTQSELTQYIQQLVPKKVTELTLCFEELTELPPDLGQLTQLQTLDLSFNQLTQFPPEIAQLTQLQELYLNDNQLLQLSPALGHLTQLQSLVLSGNRLTQLPPEMGHLTQLQLLDLNSNQLTHLPPTLGQLTSLQQLNLSNNRLTQLPPQLGQLTLLQQLDLSDNQLTDLPPELGQLTLLQRLDLSHNQLTKLPADFKRLTQLQQLSLRDNQLTHLPLEIRQLARFMEANINKLSDETKYDWCGLQLQENPLRFTLPPEMLGKTYRPTEIVNYYFNLTQAKPLHEAKILVIGQSKVGKTSLVNRLLYHRYNPYELTTEGIAINRWSITTPHRETIDLNVWDFGEPEIMPITHQFFLTKRSLYLLVLDAQRSEQENRVEYWLKLICNVGGDSPILVVINKSEDSQLALNRKGLIHKYPSLKAIINISCQEFQGIEVLKQQIAEWVDKLEDIRNPFPTAWFNLKKQLGMLTRDYLNYSDYVQLCQPENILEATSQRTLIGFLHDLGIVLNFREEPLHDTIIFKPEWVAQGIYKLLNHQQILQHHGVLPLRQLNDWLNSPRYPAHKQLFLIEIMKQFELGFTLADQQQFLIPRLLPKEQPELTWEIQQSLAFQYHYEVLPNSIISRLMVRLHTLIDHHTYWYTGVVLVKEQSQALIKADLEDHKIFIWVNGEDHSNRALLALIRAQLNYIHQSISKLRVIEQVPYKKNVVIPYKNLLKFLEKGIYLLYIPEANEIVDIIKLLDGVEEQYPLSPLKPSAENLLKTPSPPTPAATPSTLSKKMFQIFETWKIWN